MFQSTPYQPSHAFAFSNYGFYSSNLILNPCLQSYIVYNHQPLDFIQNTNSQDLLQTSVLPRQPQFNDELAPKDSNAVNLSSNQAQIQNKQLFAIQSLRKNEQGSKLVNKQKFGRNIVSNIFHLMINFVKRQKKVKKIIERIIQRNSMSMKMNQFYQILKRKTAKLSSYATSQQIKEFCSGALLHQKLDGKNYIKQQEFSKILRIVGKLYFEYYHIPYVYSSNKIKRQSKKLHKNAIRKILALS